MDEDAAGRYFLFKHFNIKAIVSLPAHAFLPHTPTNTSLLLAEKKSVQQETEFKEEWMKQSAVFDEKLAEIYQLLPSRKADVDFGSEGAGKNTTSRALLSE